MKNQPEISNIYFSEQAFSQIDNILKANTYSSVFILLDENVHEKCLPFFLQNLPSLKHYEVLEIEPGEDSKSAPVLFQLWEVMSELGADRHTLLLNLGGGVVSDLGGFLASTYMRGIAFVNFPTSLLAMADAAAGAKTGINLSGFKNRVGTFAHAKMVGIVPEFLETLPLKEVMSGLAEMFKHGLVADADHFWQLSKLNPEHPEISENLLEKTVAIKLAITREDPTESGLRKILNFGHTLGHALESHSHESGKALKHGHAVALGMLVELELSVQYTALNRAAADEAAAVISAFYQWPACNWNAKRLLELMRGDKKNRQGELRFSLLKTIGQAAYDVPVPEKVVLEILQKPQTFGQN